MHQKSVMNTEPTITKIRVYFVNALRIGYSLSIYDKKNESFDNTTFINLFQRLVFHVIWKLFVEYQAGTF